MKCQIARGVRVFITKEEYEFVVSLRGKTPFMLHNLPIEQQAMAQRLGDKTIFVRKKLTNTTQYNLNKNIKFLYE
jgi:hypothetical protein